MERILMILCWPIGYLVEKDIEAAKKGVKRCFLRELVIFTAMWIWIGLNLLVSLFDELREA